MKVKTLKTVKTDMVAKEVRVVEEVQVVEEAQVNESIRLILFHIFSFPYFVWELRKQSK